MWLQKLPPQGKYWEQIPVLFLVLLLLLAGSARLKYVITLELQGEQKSVVRTSDYDLQSFLISAFTPFSLLC